MNTTTKTQKTIDKIREQALTLETIEDGTTVFTVRVRVGKKGDRVHDGIGYITADGKIGAPAPLCGTRGGLYGLGVAQAVTTREITCEKCRNH